MSRGTLLFALLFTPFYALGCDTAIGDRSDVGPSDAPGRDAPGLDAEGLDAPGMDAAGLDAPGMDAAGLDAPGLDAPAILDDAGTPPDLDAFVPVTDSGTSPPPPFEVVFSRRPDTNARDTTIEDRLIQLIDAALPGSRIRVAMYTFTRTGPADALIRARTRGVDVRIVLDGDADGLGSEVGTLTTGLGAANVHLCDAPGSACVGSGIMHHKTFLFSALSDGSTNVVVQASHNLTTNQLSMHNNAVIIRGDAALFSGYEATWNDLFRDVEIPDYYRTIDGDLATRVYFFPRSTGGDTSVSILNNITCDATSRIRVAMAFFTDARSEVADALAARAREGCDVRVVAGDAEIPLGGTVASRLTAAGVQLTRYPDRSGWGLHSKYFLIDAPYAGSVGHRRLVFTGSHNWTGPALTINDETQLRIEDDVVFAGFLSDWDHVRASAVRP